MVSRSLRRAICRGFDSVRDIAEWWYTVTGDYSLIAQFICTQSCDAGTEGATGWTYLTYINSWSRLTNNDTAFSESAIDRLIGRCGSWLGLVWSMRPWAMAKMNRSQPSIVWRIWAVRFCARLKTPRFPHQLFFRRERELRLDGNPLSGSCNWEVKREFRVGSAPSWASWLMPYIPLKSSSNFCNTEWTEVLLKSLFRRRVIFQSRIGRAFLPVNDASWRRKFLFVIVAA